MSAVTRKKARRFALQALYQWQMTGQDLHEVEAQFVGGQDMGKADKAYFKELLHGVPAHREELDAQLAPFLDRRIEEVDPVERAALRLGAYELAFRPDVPFRVVINEAVELSKTFGAEHGHRFVNGVLDKLAAELRPVEVQALKKKNH